MRLLKKNTRIRFGFKSKNQLPWFIIWREYLFKGEVTFAETLFVIHDRSKY